MTIEHLLVGEGGVERQTLSFHNTELKSRKQNVMSDFYFQKS